MFVCMMTTIISVPIDEKQLRELQRAAAQRQRKVDVFFVCHSIENYKEAKWVKGVNEWISLLDRHFKDTPRLFVGTKLDTLDIHAMKYRTLLEELEASGLAPALFDATFDCSSLTNRYVVSRVVCVRVVIVVASYLTDPFIRGLMTVFDKAHTFGRVRTPRQQHASASGSGRGVGRGAAPHPRRGGMTTPIPPGKAGRKVGATAKEKPDQKDSCALQ